MDKNRLSDIIKNAAKVNISYSATLLNLSKDYLKELNNAVSKDVSNFDNEDASEHKSENKPENNDSPMRAPLIVAGRKGEVANASIAVNNTLGMSGTVSLIINGDFAEASVEPEPKSLSLEAGESAIVRILVDIDDSLEVNKNYSGSMIIPELGVKVAEFIVRRLPDDNKVKSKKTKRKPTKSSKKAK